MRIVSLIASATEMVAALGCADQLVAVSHECDWPPEAVDGRPVVTRPKINVTKKSLDIHKDIEAIVARGLGVYEIDVAALKQAKPDVIITQDQCEICAVTREDVLRATQECLGYDVHIVTLHPDSLEDIFRDILKVGKALSLQEESQGYVEELKEKMDVVARQTVGLSHKPCVVSLEWMNPLMAAGNWIPEMVRMAGGINEMTKEGDHTRMVSLEDLIQNDPDILLVMPCGFKIEQTLENRIDLDPIPGFRNLKAYREGHIYIIDGNVYMNRPGPRILESLYILAGLFHPTLFKNFIPRDAIRKWPIL